jgi:hypothetical protein
MPVDYGLKAFGWVFDLLDHCVAHIAESHDISICLILLLTLLSTLLTLKPGLIKVNILTHSNPLCRNKQLEQCRQLGIPILIGRATPRAQQRQTHLPTRIQIRIKPNLPIARRRDRHFGWGVRIDILTEDVEGEGAIRIGCIFATHNDYADDVDTLLVAADEDGVGVLAGQGAGEVGQLL